MSKDSICPFIRHCECENPPGSFTNALVKTILTYKGKIW
jgi:hypothetical protein